MVREPLARTWSLNTARLKSLASLVAMYFTAPFSSGQVWMDTVYTTSSAVSSVPWVAV